MSQQDFQATGVMIRNASAPVLSEHLRSIRRLTQQMLLAYAQADLLALPVNENWNLPLWEAAHVAWFSQWWIARNPQIARGNLADPSVARLSCTHLKQPHGGDDFYDSSRISHATRWRLPLLTLGQTQAYLEANLEQTLLHLERAEPTDQGLYFFRLALLHEAMHLEAAVYTAQAVAQQMQAMPRVFELPKEIKATINSVAACAYSVNKKPLIHIKKQAFLLGFGSQGFAFDNELSATQVKLKEYAIDARPVTWAQYLKFIESTGHALPRYLRRSMQQATRYECFQFGQWQTLDMQQSAVHLTWHDAQAFCQWADRRLPTEVEWECAALSEPAFFWGDVWEWTVSDFSPYPGFVPHPYRDYSQPWFGARKILRGACAATLPVMRHPKYRNFFSPERSDIYSGFRTCSLP